jgi:hypothetical protein
MAVTCPNIGTGAFISHQINLLSSCPRRRGSPEASIKHTLCSVSGLLKSQWCRRITFWGRIPSSSYSSLAAALTVGSPLFMPPPGSENLPFPLSRTSKTFPFLITTAVPRLLLAITFTTNVPPWCYRPPGGGRQADWPACP